MKVNPYVKQALESFEDDVAEGIPLISAGQFDELAVSQEGLIGVLAGAALGSIPGVSIVTNLGMKAERRRLEKEIDEMCEKIARENNEAIVRVPGHRPTGRLTGKDILKSIIFGGFGTGLYGGYQGHHVEELHRDLKKKVDEYNRLTRQAANEYKKGVVSKEDIAPDFQTEASADALDMSAAQSELSAISDEGDTFGTALESLVKIYSAMEDFAGKGFGSEAANFADIAIRSAVKPTKMEAPMIAACEAFDRRPAIALSLSQETLGSYIAELWEKIKKFFSNIWEMVKKFGELVFSANARLRNYAQKIEDRARAAGGSPKAASIKLSQKQAQAICDKNGVQNHHKLIDLKDFENASQSCLRVSAEAHKALGVNAYCLQQMFKTGDAKNVAGFVNEVAKNGVGIPEFFSHHANEDGKAVYYSDTLPGSIRFKLVLKEKVDASTGVFDAVWHARQLSNYRISTETVPTNISAFVMYPTMKLADVAHCAANAIKMTEAIDEVAHKAKEMDSRTADIIKGYSHNPREDMNATDRAATSAVARQLMRIESMRYELMMHVVRGMSGYVRAALNVCNLSLEQYEKEAITVNASQDQAVA